MTWDDPPYIEQLTEIRELEEKLAAATARAEAAELRLKEVAQNSFESETYHSLNINKSDNPLDALLQAVKGLKGDNNG